MSRSLSPSARRAGTAALAGLALTAAGLVAGPLPASAYNPCWGDDPPPRCFPDPPPPPPPATTYVVDTHLPSTVGQPVENGRSEHVTTDVFVRRTYLRATGAETREDLFVSYHVWNDLAFAGWHVTVHEDLRTASEVTVRSTTAHTIGVTPKVFDPDHASFSTTYVTSVAVGSLGSVVKFVPLDAFSN